MPNCNCSKNDKHNIMSDSEASLRAQLLIKTAELDDTRKRVTELEEKLKTMQQHEFEYQRQISEMNLKLHYYAGKISGYQYIIATSINM